MKLFDIIAIIAFIVVALTALHVLGDPRKRIEPFSTLSPDVYEKTAPAHILSDKIDSARPYNEIGTTTSQQCYEHDGNTVLEKVGNYSQRTNNYKHTYPDSCSAPFHELVGSFYAPREGAIGAPIPNASVVKHITDCI